MASNVRGLFNKEEDSIKEINKYLQEIQGDLGAVKGETAAGLLAEQRIRRELDECNDNINKFQRYAEKSLEAGNESDARNFLTKKNQYVPQQSMLQQKYDIAAENSLKMTQMQEKLINDMAILNTQLEEIKNRMEMAKAQEKGGVAGGSKVDAMKAKVDNMQSRAEALDEINNISKKDDNLDAEFAALMAEDNKSNSGNPSVDDDLAAMKAKMGL
jgi:phage shock protein A